MNNKIKLISKIILISIICLFFIIVGFNYTQSEYFQGNKQNNYVQNNSSSYTNEYLDELIKESEIDKNRIEEREICVNHKDENLDKICDFCKYELPFYGYVDNKVINTVVEDSSEITIEGTMPKNAQIQTEVIHLEEALVNAKKYVNSSISSDKILYACDISMLSGDSKYQPNNYNEKVKVTISDVDIKEDNIAILHIIDDNNYEFLKAHKVNNNEILFYTRTFSDFVVMEVSDIDTGIATAAEGETTFDIVIDSEEYKKEHIATLLIGEISKEVTYDIEYTWTQTSATPQSYDYSEVITVSDSSELTKPISKQDGTGIYYLHVKINEQGKDEAVTLSTIFYMDNTKPTVSIDEIETDTVAINSSKVHTMKIYVTDIHSGIITNEFTPDDIIVKVNGIESQATKNLTNKSMLNGVYEYDLQLSNLSETGMITLEVKEGAIEDNTGNVCGAYSFNLTKKVGSDYVGMFGDNVAPVVLMTGEATLITVPEGHKLSGILDERYLNQYYTIKIPLSILDVGGQDLVDILDLNDIKIFAGTEELSPTTKTLVENIIPNEVDNSTKLNVYRRDYELTLSGLLKEGYSEITVVAGAIKDLAGNLNVETKFAPYTKNDANEETRIYIDNTKPQPMLKEIRTPQFINGASSVQIELYIKDDGAGIREGEFALEDMNFQVDGAIITNIQKQMIASSLNNYQTPLGSSVSENYTYTLTLSNINKDGKLRIQIPEGKIIDKANNENGQVTIDVNVTVDSTGPKIGPLTINKNENGEVISETIKVEVSNCTDQSGIAKYEWQRSEDGVTFEKISEETSTLSISKLEDAVLSEKIYYYRVIVTDILGNSTTSKSVAVRYRNSLNTKPTIRLTETIENNNVVKIEVIVKSKSLIKKVVINEREISKNVYEANLAISNKEFTITFDYDASENGIYAVTVIDEKNNVVTETITISKLDNIESEIQYEKYDATAASLAKIVFTSNKPIRIVDKDAYASAGIIFDTINFSTKITAIVADTVDFKEDKNFIFENQGLTKVTKTVKAPLITKFAYLRFANVSSKNLNMTIPQIESLVENMASVKYASSNGQTFSYYGFKNVKVQIATSSDLQTAQSLGKASKTQVISKTGELIDLKSKDEIVVQQNSSYSTNNITGVYNQSAGLLTNYDSNNPGTSNSTYRAFRVTIMP